MRDVNTKRWEHFEERGITQSRLFNEVQMKWSVFGSLGENDFLSPGKFMLYSFQSKVWKRTVAHALVVARSSTKVIFGFGEHSYESADLKCCQPTSTTIRDRIQGTMPEKKQPQTKYIWLAKTDL